MSAEDAIPSLGTLTDIWVLIVLIIPGFITFRIISWLAVYEAKFDQFSTTIYSLMFSLMIFVPIAVLNNIESLQEIRTVIIEPPITAEMIGFSVVFGLGGGLFLKYTVRRKFYSGAPWDRFGNEYLSKYVFLYTIDGKMYRGWVKRIARGKEEKKEICLGEPEVMTKDAVGIKRFVKMGDEMYFPESSVQKILRRQ